ncbi:hypothetical protein CGK93_09945 [Arthrobacter sp. YN]|nr:hypothetical protein CGK93_09945 [Arthrobacter sp. YN]
MILTRLAKNGVTGFRGTAGRRWGMSSYAEMAARSATSNAMLQGHTGRIRESGIDTALVSDARGMQDLPPVRGHGVEHLRTHHGTPQGRQDRGRFSLGSEEQRAASQQLPPLPQQFNLPGITKRPGKDTQQTPRVTLSGSSDGPMSVVSGHSSTLTSAHRIRRGAGNAGSQEASRQQAEFRTWREDNERKILDYRTSLSSR